MRFHSCLLLPLFVVGCSVETADDGDVDESAEAVTSGKVTSARPEVGLLHMDGVRGLMGDMGWGTGTVVSRRDAVLTAIGPTKGATTGTFTITHGGGAKSVHRVTGVTDIGERLALLRIDPPASVDVVPAVIANATSRSETVTFYGYGYRNVVCMPMTGSDGKKSYVTRRFGAFGGLFTGPLGVGYTCEADIGGAIFAGGVDDTRHELVAVDTDARVDRYDAPAQYESEISAALARF